MDTVYQAEKMSSPTAVRGANMEMPADLAVPINETYSTEPLTTVVQHLDLDDLGDPDHPNDPDADIALFLKRLEWLLKNKKLVSLNITSDCMCDLIINWTMYK